MATQFTTVTDMVGFKSLSIPNAEQNNFNSIALETEECLILDLLGAELYNAFETDVDAGSGTPTQQKHIDLLNGVTWIDNTSFVEDVTYNLKGIKEALKYFVYYEWLNQVSWSNNFVGKAQNTGENATQMDRQSLNVETQNRYNKGIDLYNELYRFVEYYEEIEEEATGISEVAGTYTVTLGSTKYLIDGDIVTIDGNDYTVANLITDTSFEFTAATGLTFISLDVTWYPFEDALLRIKNKIWFNGMI